MTEEHVSVELVQYYVVVNSAPVFLDPQIYRLSHIQYLAEFNPGLIFFEECLTVSIPRSSFEVPCV